MVRCNAIPCELLFSPTSPSLNLIGTIRQVVGIMVQLENFMNDSEEKNHQFVHKLLEKQLQRTRGVFNRQLVRFDCLGYSPNVELAAQDEHLKAIELTKTAKRRKGVAHFVKYFPVSRHPMTLILRTDAISQAYITKVESQLGDANALEVRSIIDAAYDKIVQTIFESLQQIAKLDGEGEDKGQLNYHVILIGEA